MVDAQQMRWKTSTAVLAFVSVTRQHVAAAQVDFLLGQPIECEQANHTGNLDLEVDRSDPVVFGLFDFGTQFAHFAPGIEGIRGELPLLHRDHLGQLAAEQPKSPPHVYDVDRHVEPIEHKNAAGERAAGGGRGGMRGNSAPASRAVYPRRVSLGCVKPLHVPPPELCQSCYCSRFFWRIPARTARNRGRSAATSRVDRSRQTPPIRRKYRQIHWHGSLRRTYPAVWQSWTWKQNSPVRKKPFGPRGKNSSGSACQQPDSRIRMSDVGCGSLFSASARAGRQPGAGK